MASGDEQAPEFGPNLAENQTLCTAVAKLIYQKHWLTLYLQQQLLWNTWRRIDDIWRARINPSDLDVKVPLSKQVIETSKPTQVDLISSQAQSPAGFKQMKALTDIVVQMSWQDGPPGKFLVPDYVYENPLYNPSQQSADAANELRDQSVDECDVKQAYRKNVGQFIRYGHAWVLADFERTLEDIQYRFVLNPAIAQEQVQLLAQQEGAMPQLSGGQGAPITATFTRKVIKRMVTHFRHLNVRDVFIDQLLPCDDISRQPCPMVRRHLTDYDLDLNAYEPTNNPFGWLNIEKAKIDQKGHYALNQDDEVTVRQAMEKRFQPCNVQSLSDKDAVKQLWTCWPLLSIDEAGNLDTGDGTPCPTCGGEGTVINAVQNSDFTVSEEKATCPQCTGTKKVHVPCERYIIQMYGGVRGGATVMRIQKMPKGMEDPPLLFAADMVEDDATSIPMSRAEVAMVPMYQLAKAENQFQHGKDWAVNRGWKKRMDGPAWGLDCNQPGVDIPFESNPEEVMRVEANNYDETITLLDQFQRKEDDIQRIFGATDQLLGLLSQGRRSALELGNAIEAGKNPIIVMADAYNSQMFGGWMKLLLRNIELYGDRDWIRRKTGKTTFGKPRIYTSVAADFFKKTAMVQNVRYLMEAANMNPNLQAVVPQLFNETAKLMGIAVMMDDGGLKRNIQDGLTIITKILGDGIFEPPTESDPHEIYIAQFQQAMKDPYWQKAAPQNFPLLAQRLQLQMMLFQQQQMAMLQQQAMQNQMLNPPPEEGDKGSGNRPARGARSPQNAGQQNQNAQG